MKMLRFFMLLCISFCLYNQAAHAYPQVQFDTTFGKFVVELNSDLAPISSENFLRYVKEGHYDDTVFHRIINGFMVQGGGYTTSMQEKPTREPIPLESRNNLKNVKGSVAMARTANPNSATAQFFINVADNDALDYPGADGHGYAVFGKIVSGMDVIDKIRAVPTTSYGSYRNVPATPVIIQSAKQISQ